MSIRICILALLISLSALTFGQSGTVIQTITVIGNQQVSKEAVLAAIRTKPGQAYLQANLDQDRKSLEDLGFFQAVDVRAKPIDDKNWEIVVEVSEYPVVKEIRVVGNKAVKTEEILKVIDVVPGKIFNARNIQPSVTKIKDLYKKKGFFEVIEDFSPLRDSPGTINLSIIELTVSSVSVEGNDKTKTSVLKHLIKTRAGQPFDERRWGNDLRRLLGTQWFENVRSVDSTPEPGKIDLIADVKEMRTGNFGVGLQVDPRSSFAGFIKLQETNFHGSGESVGINFLEATNGGGPSLDLTFGNPFLDRHDTSMQVSLYSHLIYRFAGTSFGGSVTPTLDNRYSERRTGAALGFGRPLNDQDSASILFRAENITTANLRTNAQTGFIKQDGELATVTLGYTINRRDVDIEASRGNWLRFDDEPGYSNVRSIGGDINDPAILGTHFYNKVGFEFRQYFTPQKPRTLQQLDAPRRVFAFRLRYGAITGNVPFFEQFFAGGSDTIRGYDEDRFWGKQQLLTTLEYRHPLQKSFSVIAFVDYGGAWGGYGSVNRFTQSKSLSLNLGYGIGFSFRTPLGPLRLDLGFNKDGKTKTHFLIGNSF